MYKVALSGRPCGGKSTALMILKEMLKDKGYGVIIVPEAASDVIAKGFVPGKDGLSPLKFQYIVFLRQLAYERRGQLQAKRMELATGQPVVILYDRSLFDQLAYISRSDFRQFLAKEGMSEKDLQRRYDRIVHLVSASVGTDYYTTDSNSCRLETADEARAVEARTLSGNKTFANLVVVDNSTDFQRKMERVMAAVMEVVTQAA